MAAPIRIVTVGCVARSDCSWPPFSLAVIAISVSADRQHAGRAACNIRDPLHPLELWGQVGQRDVPEETGR